MDEILEIWILKVYFCMGYVVCDEDLLWMLMRLLLVKLYIILIWRGFNDECYLVRDWSDDFFWRFSDDEVIFDYFCEWIVVFYVYGSKLKVIK